MKIKRLASAFGAVVFAGFALSDAASAATTETFDLAVNGCGRFTSCFAPGVTSLGTVTVTENSGALDFDVSLSDAFVNANPLERNALSFSIVGSDVSHLRIEDLTAGFIGYTGLNLALPFGFYGDAVDYVGSSRQGHTPSSFSFVVTDRGDNLTLSDLAPNLIDGQYIYAVSDLYAHSHAGDVGAILAASSTGVPEPATWSMMLLGVGIVGWRLRTGRQGAASPSKA